MQFKANYLYTNVLVYQQKIDTEHKNIFGINTILLT